MICFRPSEPRGLSRAHETLNLQAIYLQYLILRQLHPRWDVSAFKRMTPREREYWKDAGNYLFERKLSALEAGKQVMEAP